MRIRGAATTVSRITSAHAVLQRKRENQRQEEEIKTNRRGGTTDSRDPDVGPSLDLAISSCNFISGKLAPDVSCDIAGGLFLLSSSNEYVSSRRTSGGREGAPPSRLDVGFIGGNVADCPNRPFSNEFPHFHPES